MHSTHLLKNVPQSAPVLLFFTAVLVYLFFPLFVHAADVSLTASPSSVYTGGEITVTWKSSDTFKCVGTGFSTGDATSGTKKVTVSSSGVKTYSVVCYDQTPACSLALIRTLIEDAPGRNTCTGSRATVFYSPNGSCYPKNATCQTSTSRSGRSVRGEPGGGGTYDIKMYRCEGSCGTVSASRTVTVNDPPPPPNPSVQLSLSPATVTAGNSTLLSWSSTRATTCRGNGFSTGGATNGSVTVTPTKNTTYSITCDSEVYSSTPGTWQYAFSDIVDLWCTTRPSYSNYYTKNECPRNAVPSGSCTGSEVCAVNKWSTGKGDAKGETIYCNLLTDMYRCNGGSAPNQITGSISVKYNNAPNAPTITGPTSGVTGTTYTFSFQATDPDKDTVRYRADLNNDGIVDRNLPTSGYVTSNTSQSSTYSWSTAGTYVIKARTQDGPGAQSGWTSHTITIANACVSQNICSGGNVVDSCTGALVESCSYGCGSGQCSSPQCGDGIDNDGDGRIDLADPGCGSGTDNDEFNVFPQCSDGIDNNGINGIDYPNDPACDSADDNDEGMPPSPSVSLTVSRWLVSSGSPVTLTWSAANVKDDSCTLTGTNGDSWGPYSEGGGPVNSSALTGKTTFTLSCTDYNDVTVSESAAVRLIPRYLEL